MRKQIEKELVTALEETTVWPLFQREEYKGCGPRTVARLIASVVDIRRFVVKPDEAELQKLKQSVPRSRRKYANDLARISCLLDCSFKDAGGRKYWKLQKLASQTGSEDLKRAVQLHKASSVAAESTGEERIQARRVLRRACDAKVESSRVGVRARHQLESGSTTGVVPAREPMGEAVRIHTGAASSKETRRGCVIHPQVLEIERKRYTDGHIHKMACWRTATQFVRKLANDWMKLEGSPQVTSTEVKKAA